MAFVVSTNAFSSSFVDRCTTKKTTCSTNTPVMISRAGAVFGLKTIIIAGAVVASTIVVLPQISDASIFRLNGERPKTVGLQFNRYLSSCPATPNCISSMENAFDSHYVPSWTYNANPKEPKKSMQDAVKELTQVITEYPRATIIQATATSSEIGKGQYIYAEFESKLLGFVDDVEFFFQPDNNTVEYRSASRLGKDDLGANRKRIRDIRQSLQEMDKQWASTGYN